MKVLVVTDNLMTRAWLEPILREASAEKCGEAAGEAPDVALVDLTAGGAVDRLAEIRRRHPAARILAFGPHMDAEAFRAAKAAGADEAVARGKARERLSSLLTGRP